MNRSLWRAAALGVAAVLACGDAQALITETISFAPRVIKAGGDTISVPSSVNSVITSDATLIINVEDGFVGNLTPGGGANNSLTVDIDGQVIALPFNFTIGPTPPCGSATATVTIPKSVLAPLVADGQLTIRLTTNGAAAALCAATVTVSGSLTFNSEDESGSVAEATSAAQSMATSRGGLAIANLPSFSTRLGGGGGGSSVSGLGDGSDGSIAFATSLSALREQAARDDVTSAPAAFHVGAETGEIDFWIGGSYTYFESDVGGLSSEGDIGLLQAGLDYRAGEQLLIGLFAMGDMLKNDAATGADSSGIGFLAGPYAVIGLAENIHLEGVAAAGMAFNEIDSAGLPTADYESQRLLLSTRLSGDFRAGDWTVTPSGRVSYYAERQESFTDGSGGTVPEDTTTLGQLRVGPEVAYDLSVGDRGLVRPFAGVEGVWSFQQTEQTINGSTIAPDDLSASVSAGFDASLGAATLRAAGRYDGLGTDEFEAITGELQLRLPLN